MTAKQSRPTDAHGEPRRRRARLTLVAVLTQCACLAVLTGSATARDPAVWPFASSSPWNMPIGSGASYAPPSNACSAGVSDPALTTDVNAAQWSHPVYIAAASDPLWKVRVGGAAVASVHAPKGISPSAPTYSQDPGTDAHLHIVDPTRAFVDETWHAHVYPTKHLIVADSHTRNPLTGSGVGAGGERAYGGSAIGGEIRSRELQARSIPHALAIALPRDHQRLGWVWPASAEDSFAATDYAGSVPMGTLVAIPPTVDVTKLNLSPAGLAAARALQNYGAYDVDSSGDLALYAEPQADSLAAPIRNDLPALRSLLRCVTNNSPQNPGGGGTPRAPLAPPL